MTWWIVLAILAAIVIAAWVIAWYKSRNYNPYWYGVNKCVMCGQVIPEGRMVCPDCERKVLGE